MRRIKLTIEYDGTAYAGWQRQKNSLSIQEVLEEAILKLTGQQVKTVAAGRTDAGVHALNQVVHFDVNSSLKIMNFLKGLNFYLPSDIAVKHVEEVDEIFHARYSAKSRSYIYLMKTNYSALFQNRAWIYLKPLQLDAMKETLPVFLGEHDFESFCSRESILDHYRCQVQELSLEQENDLIVFRIKANRFVHNMVRAIMGTLVLVGKGAIQPKDVEQILKARDRTAAGPTAPPQGLYLNKVEY
jgi:tRNA pseudouridine38-40 synthase